MTEAQIQDIYSRLDSLTSEVNSLKLLTGTIGTSQVAMPTASYSVSPKD
ncbi:hypothetical protein [uncultured Nostoc sp.]